MHTFGVWAPFAQRVEVEVAGEERFEMDPGPCRGWWMAQVMEAGPGTDYRFALDGGDPLPDPRSPWQPAGVDGPSRVVDHGSFRWTDDGWRGVHLPSAVIYELHVGTFSQPGTFAGVADHLDHLVELGVDVIELMPVAEFPGRRGWGYDGVDLFAPHHRYGGPDGLKALVDACHARGLAVALDVVYNHLGPAGNYLGRFGPYFTDRYRTPWGPAVNLDGPGSPEVRAFIVDNALSWLRDYHCDGLRIDAVHAMVDTSAIHILEELAARVGELANQLGRPLFLIAESDLNDPRLVTPREAGGYGLDAQWSDDFHHALHAVLTGERVGYYADFGSLSDVATALRQAFVYDGRYSGFRDRVHGRRPVGVPGTRFIGYLQDHDQVGNRPWGDRAPALMSEGRLAVGMGLVLTSPFVPMLFQGEEWGTTSPFRFFTEHADPSLRDAVREGRRSELAWFGWKVGSTPDPEAEETFLAAKLDWSEAGRPDHARFLAWTRELIAIRRAWPELMDGRLDRVDVTTDDAAGWLRLIRGRVAVVAHIGATPATVPLGRAWRSARILAQSHPDIRIDDGAALLPADSLVMVAGEEAGGRRW